MKTLVSLKKCNNYEYNLVRSSLLKTIEDLGGLEKYISKGDKILLKVNLLMKKKPEEATTTHPVFVKALADILLEFGAKVLIGDSPGGPFTKIMLKGIYTATGMQEIADTSEATLNYNFGSCEKENPKGILLKKIIVTDMLNDVDKVISVSKLKTHGMMTFTGAVKNMFGVVPGILKAEFHLNMPKYEDFANALVDICLCANPVLSFMDGIVAMEGDGPSAGNPRNVNVIIASTSPYHLDKVACKIINLDLEKVPTVKSCAERKICTLDLSDVQLLGDDIKNFDVKDFVIPKSILVNPFSDKLPQFVKNFLGNNFRPRPLFDHDLCIGCNICAENCPAKIIEMVNNRPEFDVKKCIRCYCCQELCPKKAVAIHKPFALRVFSKKK